MKQISGERLQDHWSSGFVVVVVFFTSKNGKFHWNRFDISLLKTLIVGTR